MMPTLHRRYKASLLVAVVLIIGLYHVLRVRNGQSRLLYADQDKTPYNQAEVTTADPGLPTSSLPGENPLPSPQDADPVGSEPATNDQNPPAENALVDESSLVAEDTENREGVPLSETDGEPVISENDRVRIDEILSNRFDYDNQGRYETTEKVLVSEQSHWEPQKEHFPLLPSAIFGLPIGPPKDIPAIQYSFKKPSGEDQEKTEARRHEVLEEFQHAWNGYKEYALPHDELAPISKKYKDPFNGWGATLVDSLDSLWIMGLRDEFEKAVQDVARIDFQTSPRKEIPLFETVIRYLGGLIAAYDVSDRQYPLLLEKAEELTEILMGAFDTPNRMPHTYYFWRPSYASQAHRALTMTVLAELGSLSLEFTRLAQITGEDKYYDAIARITNELETFQKSTSLPGLWPATVDASGCNRSAIVSESKIESQSSPQQEQAELGQGTAESDVNNQAGDAGGAPVPAAQADVVTKRQVNSAKTLKEQEDPSDDSDCQVQGLAPPPRHRVEVYTIGAKADSAYEYLPKEWLLLGGLSSQYESMYKDAITTVKEKLIFRPMTKTNRDIRFAGTWKRDLLEPSPGQDKDFKDHFEYEAQHLTCFAGGMFALGAKIFQLDEDLELARQLTDGCVWAYEATATGVMPELFHLTPCDAGQPCIWNETRWWQFVESDADAQRASAKAPMAQTRQPGQTTTSESSDPEQAPETAEMPQNSSISGDDLAMNLLPIKQFDRRFGPEDKDNLIASSESARDPAPVENEPDFGGAADSSLEHFQDSSPASSLPPPPSQEESVRSRIQEGRLPPGFVKINDAKYILRPEAIESVFIMYRITGDSYWREQGWKMFKAIQAATHTEHGNSAIANVTLDIPRYTDSMESFWLAETLKYFFLLFSDPNVISLDEYVL